MQLKHFQQQVDTAKSNSHPQFGTRGLFRTISDAGGPHYDHMYSEDGLTVMFCGLVMSRHRTTLKYHYQRLIVNSTQFRCYQF